MFLIIKYQSTHLVCVLYLFMMGDAVQKNICEKNDGKNSAVVIKTNKGKNDKIFLNGEEYIRDGQSADGIKIYYACAHYKRVNCRGRLIQDKSKSADEQFVVTKEHSFHTPDARRLGRAEALDSLKRKASESVEVPRNLISKVMKPLDIATAAVMPSMTSLRRTIHRVRASDINCPTQPNSLDELIVPEKYKICDNEPFLIHDSEAGNDRILIFSTPRALNLLKRIEIMLVDGTFDIVPPLFTQLYTLQGNKTND